MASKIKNVIFDVGNVLVRWSPIEVIESIFPELNAQTLYLKSKPIWIDLNLGKLTEKEAIKQYEKSLCLDSKRLSHLMLKLKEHQTPIVGSIELLEELVNLDLSLFSITDNIKEFIEHHKKTSKFPKYFKDIVTSFDVGVLKPDKRIYNHLLEKHNLNPKQSIFIDDLTENVDGAIALGIHAFQFINVPSCKKQLMALINN